MQRAKMGKSFRSKFLKVVSFGSGLMLIVAFGSTELFAQYREPVGSTTQYSNTPRKSEEAVQTLVAPIALYPDALVAQILAASTSPTEIVQADRWLQTHSNLQSQQLAAAVDQQPWDASVKALTAFPTVLSNMDQNLSWTAELGQTYFEQQQDVLDAIQILRQRAEQAGNLQGNTQERVVNEGPSIVIEPAYPDVCYLPIYDPWLIYGAPLVPYPGYFYGPWIAAPYVSFGPAIRIGFFSGFGWGWPAWGFNWENRVVVFNRFPYVPPSRFFFHGGPVFVSPRGFSPRVLPPRVGSGFGLHRGFDTNHWIGGNRSNHVRTIGGFAGRRWVRGSVGEKAFTGRFGGNHGSHRR